MPLANDHKGRVMNRGLCDGIVTLTQQRLAFDTKLGQRASTHTADSRMSIEGRVTYMKLHGDQLLHLAEMGRHDRALSMPECEGLAAGALEAYVAAQEEASSKNVSSVNTNTNANSSRSNGGGSGSSGSSSALSGIHPLRVELALRISSVLLHLLDRPVEAWEAGYPTYLAAAERPARLSARGLAATQALRDHLACIDIRGDCESHHGEGSSNCDNNGNYTHVQEQTQDLFRDEWGFLRMSGGPDEGFGGVAGTEFTASDQLRSLAQVKQARACMDGVTDTKRVLLGTMEHADIVRSALRQIFDTYTKKHAKPVQQCSGKSYGNAGKHVQLQGRNTASSGHARQSPSLSWPGFEAVCHAFDITAPATIRHPHLHGHHHQHHDIIKHHPSRATLPGYHQSPRTNSNAPVATATQRQNSLSRTLSNETTGRCLLSGVQTRIAFVSACTHGTVVASFPHDGEKLGGDGNVGTAKRVLDYGSRVGSAEEGERMSFAGDDTAYWRARVFGWHTYTVNTCFTSLTGLTVERVTPCMERIVLPGSPSDDNNTEPGLNFHQFVDALARCGLIGFAKGTGAGIGVRANIEQFVSAAERIQAVFISQMKLLDRRHVDTKLQGRVARQRDRAAAEGDTDKAGTSKKGANERLAGGGKKERVGGKATRGTNSGGLQGRIRNAKTMAAVSAADLRPAPVTTLAPVVQTTPRQSRP